MVRPDLGAVGQDFAGGVGGVTPGHLPILTGEERERNGDARCTGRKQISQRHQGIRCLAGHRQPLSPLVRRYLELHDLTKSKNSPRQKKLIDCYIYGQTLRPLSHLSTRSNRRAPAGRRTEALWTQASMVQSGRYAQQSYRRMKRTCRVRAHALESIHGSAMAYSREIPYLAPRPFGCAV
jgi:hypothetical protein